LDNEAILRLVAVAQSGAYYAYVSICDASQTPKEPVRQILVYIAANKVAITVAIINLGYIGEELRTLNPLQGEGSLHTRVGM
jgi:hypothetical protein